MSARGPQERAGDVEPGPTTRRRRSRAADARPVNGSGAPRIPATTPAARTAAAACAARRGAERSPEAASGTRPSAASGASMGPSAKSSAPRGSRQREDEPAAASDGIEQREAERDVPEWQHRHREREGETEPRAKSRDRSRDEREDDRRSVPDRTGSSAARPAGEAPRRAPPRPHALACSGTATADAPRPRLAPRRRGAAQRVRRARRPTAGATG